MGQALDRDGNVLGEAVGDTKREVFDKLIREFKDAHEIRIRSLEQDARSVGEQEQPASQAASNRVSGDLFTEMVGMAERWRRESGTAGWQLAKESCAQDLIALVKAVQIGGVSVGLKFPETLPAH